MFRALLLFPLGQSHATMAPPVSAGLLKDGDAELPTVDLALKPEGLFSTAVGPSSKRTLAKWHVTTSPEVVDAMLGLVRSQ